MKKNLLSKLSKIKIVVSDVDGVMTDGGMYFTDSGLFMKRFDVKDGMGVILLKRTGLLTGIITSDSTEIIKSRVKRFEPDLIGIGIWEKLDFIKSYLEQENLTLENVAYIGDDVNDLDILQAVGFSACPNDAIDEVKNIVDYICKKNGGNGAFREFADLIIKNKK